MFRLNGCCHLVELPLVEYTCLQPNFITSGFHNAFCSRYRFFKVANFNELPAPFGLQRLLFLNKSCRDFGTPLNSAGSSVIAIATSEGRLSPYRARYFV